VAAVPTQAWLLGFVTLESDHQMLTHNSCKVRASLKMQRDVFCLEELDQTSPSTAGHTRLQLDCLRLVTIVQNG
jgi:hypothetical protein